MKMKDRRYFTVIDGVVAGEGQGPFCPTSKYANTLIAGDDLFATDCVATRYMGLDPNKISYLHYFLEQRFDDISLDNINVYENGEVATEFFIKNTRYADFYVVDQWREIQYQLSK